MFASSENESIPLIFNSKWGCLDCYASLIIHELSHEHLTSSHAIYGCFHKMSHENSQNQSPIAHIFVSHSFPILVTCPIIISEHSSPTLQPPPQYPHRSAAGERLGVPLKSASPREGNPPSFGPRARDPGPTPRGWAAQRQRGRFQNGSGFKGKMDKLYRKPWVSLFSVFFWWGSHCLTILPPYFWWVFPENLRWTIRGRLRYGSWVAGTHTVSQATKINHLNIELLVSAPVIVNMHRSGSLANKINKTPSDRDSYRFSMNIKHIDTTHLKQSHVEEDFLYHGEVGPSPWN